MGKSTNILRLGDPLLARICQPVLRTELHSESFVSQVAALKQTLTEFRLLNGFGRAIAMPQIGVPKRVVALDLRHLNSDLNPDLNKAKASLKRDLDWSVAKGPIALVNPEITWRSVESFKMFDDCLCFPDLLVRVRRCDSVSVRWMDENTGEWRVVEKLPRDEAELIQHELDHLDGVLAVDLAEDKEMDIITRREFEEKKAELLKTVDYHIA